jgi:hypothetical protein
MKQLHPIITVLICILAIASSGLCRNRDWDSIPPRHHRIQLDPISLLGGTLGGSYEFRFNRHHALALEGFYTFPLLGTEGQIVSGMYRYYYKQNTFGGIFVKNGNQSSKLPAPDRGDTTTYTIDLSYLTIGPNWGKSWYIKKRFPITFRIGMGYPVKREISWKNGLEYPTSPRLFETIYSISLYLDSELTIGVSF